MTTLLYGLIYVALAIAATACVVRAVRYARLPLNLRWELYPVPHEPEIHAGHGGSYFEDLDWWTKESRPNRLGEVKAMAAEIFLLHAMYRHNRKLWRWSYPFHLGLYLLIATAAAAVTAAALSLPVMLVPFVGMLACVMVMLGTAGLLAHRINDPELRNYSAPADYFNLCFFFATCAALVFNGFITTGPGMMDITRALLTCNTRLVIPLPQAIAMCMAALLIAYIPMTHMAHFIGKYFTYHAIRWGDEPCIGNRALQQRIAAYLTYKPTWAARHIGADGAATWVDLATKNPTEEKSK